MGPGFSCGGCCGSRSSIGIENECPRKWHQSSGAGPRPSTTRRQATACSTGKQGRDTVSLSPQMGGRSQEMPPNLIVVEPGWQATSLPRGGGKHRRKRGSGKLGGRSPSAAVVSTIPAALGLVTDVKTGHQCLLDSGSQVSLWPASTNRTALRSSNLRLITANGSPIKTFGTTNREIQIGKKRYSFLFISAKVTRPILGIDFLQRCKMAIDLNMGIFCTLEQQRRSVQPLECRSGA